MLDVNGSCRVLGEFRTGDAGTSYFFNIFPTQAGMGSIGFPAQRFFQSFVGTTNTENVWPFSDNSGSIGAGNLRYSTVFAVNGAIQTSDGADKDSEPLKYGLADVEKISTIKYKWKSQAALADDDPDKNHEYYGVLADELDGLFPELVYNQTRPYQLNYSELIPVMINAIKELSAEVKELKKRVPPAA
jgi:hypothetical protein